MPNKEPSTYEEYLALSQAMQRKYIADERTRYTALERLWWDYKAKAAKLGLHPLERHEIRARFDQLREMGARVPETHGDSKGQRALWAMRQAEKSKA